MTSVKIERLARTRKTGRGKQWGKHLAHCVRNTDSPGYQGSGLPEITHRRASLRLTCALREGDAGSGGRANWSAEGLDTQRKTRRGGNRRALVANRDKSIPLPCPAARALNAWVETMPIAEEQDLTAHVPL